MSGTNPGISRVFEAPTGAGEEVEKITTKKESAELININLFHVISEASVDELNS